MLTRTAHAKSKVDRNSPERGYPYRVWINYLGTTVQKGGVFGSVFPRDAELPDKASFFCGIRSSFEACSGIGRGRVAFISLS